MCVDLFERLCKPHSGGFWFWGAHKRVVDPRQHYLQPLLQKSSRRTPFLQGVGTATFCASSFRRRQPLLKILLALPLWGASASGASSSAGFCFTSLLHIPADFVQSKQKEMLCSTAVF